MDNETTKERLSAATFALEAYAKMKHNRSYALSNESRNVLGVLVAAMNQMRAAQGRNRYDAVPSPWTEFHSILQRLNDAGCNVLQERPDAEKPLPTAWVNPITQQPLPPPKTPDERGILQKSNPELLQLLDELEARPYATIRKLREAEAERQAIMAIPYGEKEHQLNPFRGDNKTAQGQFERRSPTLAKFYQSEAKDVEIPIFGRNKNMTVEAHLLKDPSTAALVRVAEQIARQWNAEDVATAKEQRAAAEQALKKLEGAARSEERRVGKESRSRWWT